MTESQIPEVILSDLVITRVIDAPVEAVWEHWTVPAKLRQWWGPKDFTAPIIEMDVRVGGKYMWCMKGPEGSGFPVACSTGTFAEVVPRQRLRYNALWANEQGQIVKAADLNMDFPDEITDQVTFEGLPDGRTILTITEYSLPLNQMFAYAYSGWMESLDKMEAALKEG